MANSRSLDAASPLTGAKFLLILLGSFAVVFAFNGVMAYDAISTFSGEVDAHPYEDGVAYNKQIATAETQAHRHWRVDVQLADPPSATFRDADGRPIAGLRVTGLWESPSDMKRDRAFRAHETAPGVYVAEGGAPKGVWDLKLDAKRGTDLLFRSRNRVTVR